MLDPIHGFSAQKSSHARFQGSRILLARMTPRSIFQDPCHTCPVGEWLVGTWSQLSTCGPQLNLFPAQLLAHRRLQGLTLVPDKNDRDD
jgi:hypothetical protein